MIFQKKCSLHYHERTACLFLFFDLIQNIAFYSRMDDIIQFLPHFFMGKYYIRNHLPVNGFIIFYDLFSK